MIIYPTRSWRNNEIVQSYMLNEISYNIALLKGPPFCRLCNSQTITLEQSETWTCLSWDTELTDTDGMGDGSSRITINTPGEYEIKLRYNFGPIASDATWSANAPTVTSGGTSNTDTNFSSNGNTAGPSLGSSGGGPDGHTHTIGHLHGDDHTHGHGHTHQVPVETDKTSVYPFTGAIAIGLNTDGSWAPGQGGFLSGDSTMMTAQKTPSFPSVSCRAKARLAQGDYIEAFAARRGGPDTLIGGQPNSSNTNPLGGGSFSARFVGV